MNPVAQSNLQEVIGIFTDGGTVMIALAVVAFLLYTSATAALVYVMQGNLNSKERERWPDWIDRPDAAKGRVGEVIRYAIHGPRLSIKRVQRRFDEVREVLILSIDRRLVVIGTLIAAAPMTGLLGTVGGMLDMFDGLAAGGGKQSMAMIASGMKEALFTTLTGLVIALPGMFIALVVREQRNKVDAALAQLQSAIVKTRFRNV
jgi:biopolymer transport protein ExbB